MAKKKEKSVAELSAEADAKAAANSTEGTPAPEPKKEEPKAPGKIQQILDHFKAGKSNKEIAALPVLDAQGNPVVTKNEKGEDVVETFHPTTISIQINKFRKANPDLYPPKAPAPTKKQLKAEAAAKKAAEKAGASAETPAAEVAMPLES